ADKGPAAPKVEGVDSAKQLSRDNWKAIGEVTTPALDDAYQGRKGWVPYNLPLGAPPPPQPVTGKETPKVIEPAPRTEFVILFVWRETPYAFNAVPPPAVVPSSVSGP